MAKTDFPLNIHRRHLLVSAAAVTTTGIVPGMKPANAAAPDIIQSSAMAREAEPANFCAATARRLLEIACRDELRREANLPLLSIPRELRRMKEQEMLDEFSRFEAAHYRAIWDQMLKRRREAEGNSNWRPSWIEGMSLQSEVRTILRQQFHLARRK